MIGTESMSRKKKTAYLILTVVLWMLVWQVAAIIIDNRIFLPSPLDTLKSLGILLRMNEFYYSVCFSLGNIAKGFLLGIFGGTVLATVASRTEFLETFLSLPMRVIKAVPVASFTILALFWVDSTELSVLISFFMVLPIIYTNVLVGIKETDRKMLEMAQVFRISLGNKVRFFYAPSVLPYLFSASSVAIGLAWKSGIAAEVIGLTKASIGNYLYEAKIYLEMPTLFAWTCVIIVISILSEKIILLLLHEVESKMRGTAEDYEELQKTEGQKEASDVAGDLPEKSSSVAPHDSSGIITLHDVSKAYGEKQVLSHVTLSISKDQPIALMGSSGIGKTTLLRIVLGTEKPDDGWVERKPEDTPISVVFQENRLCETISVEQNLKMVCKNKKQKEEIEPILERMGLKHCKKQRVASLSGGMKRRVAIGRALVYDAPVLLLDEPFQGLDEHTKQTVLSFVKERMRGKSVLLVTHEKQEGMELECKIVQL